MTRQDLVNIASGHLHAEQMVDAARAIAEFSGIPAKRVDNNKIALELCNSLFYWCLNNDRYDYAAQLIWGETLFTAKPRCTRMVWNELKESDSLMLMGAASMSKSYGAGAWFLLDWVRDPEYTSVNVVGPSEDHLKDNLFTHLVTMHRSSTLPLPGVIGDLFIGLDPRAKKSAIRGIIIPTGKKSGRLQGRKAVPRKKPHPIFGRMSRIRFFLDELEKIPVGVWKDIDNIFANMDGEAGRFKIAGAFNPEDPSGQVALRCEPPQGWEAFNPESDELWTSKRGWRVLRLDAAKCENVVENRVIYPGLQTRIGFDRIISNAGGVDTPGYWTMARACFPRGGAIYSVFSTTLATKMRGEFMFAEEPMNVASVDSALEGSDTAEMAVGRFGKAIGIRYAPSFEHPNGREVLFRDALGKPRMRWALQLDQIFPLAKGDTVKVAMEVKEKAQKFKVAPGCLMLDRTGNGAGVHDLLKSLWSEEVRGVNYQESATEKKILEEDTKTAKEEYERVVSELWFAAKKWSEFEFLKVKPEAMSEELARELTGRRYDAAKLTRVESKVDYKSRGNPSPNKADALTLLVHAARTASGVIPSAADDCAGTVVTGQGQHEEPIPVICCESNRFDDLD